MAETMSDELVCWLKSQVPKLAEQLVFVDGKPIELEREWQHKLVGSTAIYEVWNKARQIGFSYGAALRTMLRAHLFPAGSYNAVFVSINREEAREKIRYIEMLLSFMKDKKKCSISNKMQIEFENGNTIRSFPSRPVRGLSNVDLYLDEFAHIKEAREIYQGSTASTVRQGYGIAVGSTPYGRGAFYDICHGAGQPGEYKLFQKFEVPWWESHILCKDPYEARVFAPGMRTSERVAVYGRPNLVREYENLSLESFQQEYECFFLDYGSSALSQDLIMSCANGTMDCEILELDVGDNTVDVMEQVHILLQKVTALGGRLHDVFIGYDVGRQVHASELILLDWFEGKLQTRMYLTMRRCPYPKQDEVLRYVFNNTPMRRAVIDSQGIGNQLAQGLQDTYNTRVDAMNFGEVTKAEMVGSLIKAFEEQSIRFYPTMRMCRQLLEVKKVYSSNGRILYRSGVSKEEGPGGEDQKSHADLFWSLAMAVTGAGRFLKVKEIQTTRRSPILHGYGGHGIVLPKPPRSMRRRF